MMNRHHSCSSRAMLLLLLVLATALSTTKATNFLAWPPILFPRLVVFPRIRCLLKLWRLRYDVNDFDNYDRFFRDDSRMALVETGSFVGAADIREYVAAGSAAAPYFTHDAVIRDLEFTFVSYDRPSGTCEFRATAVSRLTSDPATTGAAIQFDAATLTKIYLDLPRGYIQDQRVFLKRGFWQDALSALYNSTQTRDFVCGVMANECRDYLPAGAADDCLTRLEAMPLFEYDDLENKNSSIVRYQESSQVCRSLHAGLAKLAPAEHCPHISFTPLEDPRGRIKCQTGSDKDLFLPTDLFTVAELEAFDQYCLDKGLGEDGVEIVYL